MAGISERLEASYSFNAVEIPKHHQLSKAYTERPNQMKEKITRVLIDCGVEFVRRNDGSIRYFVTNKVFPKDIKKDIWRLGSLGDKSI